MKVHAVVLGTRLVLHEVGAVLGGPQRRLKRPAVDEDVVHGLDRSEGVLRLQVRHVRARTWTLRGCERKII